MTLAQFIRVLKARWIMIAILAGLLFVGAIGWAKLSQPIFRATAQVIINVRAPETVGNQTLADQLSPDYLSTQVDVIRSERVLKTAAARLELAKDKKFLEDMEWKGKGSLDQSLVRQLSDNLSIDGGASTSRVIGVGYTANDPATAARIANAIAGAYVEISLDLQSQPAKESADWYDRRSREVQAQLAATQAKLTARQQALNISTPNQGQPNVEEARLQGLSVQLATAMAASADSRSRAGGGALPDTMVNPVIQTIQSEIAKLEGQRIQLATTAGPNNIDYRNLVAQIAGLRGQLAQQQRMVQASASTAASQAGNNVAQLEAEVAAQQRRVIESRARTDELSVLEQDVRNLQTVYDQMAARRSQLNLLGESGQSNVAILSAATPPERPTWPRTGRMAAIGLALGLLIGVVLAVVQELLDQRIRSADDFEIWLGIPSLGQLRIAPPASALIGSSAGRSLAYDGPADDE